MPRGSCGRSFDELRELRQPARRAPRRRRRPRRRSPRSVAEKRNDSCGTNATDAVQLLERDLAHVHAVDGDAARADVVDARDEVDERRLAGAGGADDGERRAGRHVERDVVQDGTVEVAEAHALEARWLPRTSRQRLHARRVGDGGLAGQHLLDALHRRRGLLVHVQRPAEVHHRHREQDDVALNWTNSPSVIAPDCDLAARRRR